MSEVVGEGVLRIRTDTSSVQSDVSKAGQDAGKGYSKGFGSGIKGLAIAVGGVLAADKVLDFAKASVSEAREAQKVGAATEAIIKATGGAAKITADQVGEMSGRLSSLTGVDDEEIQKGANLLLTFKNVKNYVDGEFVGAFDRATAAAVDLSAAGFGSIEGASKTMGKALNDPVKGISALSRAGVTFTQQQKDQIEQMVKVGDVAGAQAVILGEVEGQVGGVAQATATAGDRAKVAWGNIQEQVGGALLPVLDKLAIFFVDTLVPAIGDAIVWSQQFAPVVEAIGAAITSAFSQGGQGTAFLAQLGAVAQQVFPIILEGITTLAGVWVANWQAIAAAALPILQQLAQFVVAQVVPALLNLAAFIQTNIVPVIIQLATVFREDILPVIAQVAAFVVGQLVPALFRVYQQAAQNLAPVFVQLGKTMREQIIPAVQQAATIFREKFLPVLQPIILKVVQVIGFLVKLYTTILGKVLPIVIRLAGWWISNFIPAALKVVAVIVKVIGILVSVGKAIGTAISWVMRIQNAMIQWVTNGINKVVSAVTSLPGRLLALGGKLFSAGKSIIGKFIDGLGAIASGAGGIADSIWQAIRGVINSAIDQVNNLLDFEIEINNAPNIHVNAPDIGHIQGGTESWRGGTAMVGEVGPEFVTLPRDSRVETAARTRQLLGGQTGDGIDYARLGAAIAAAIAPLLRPIELTVPTDDPDALVMGLLNRLTAAS